VEISSQLRLHLIIPDVDVTRDVISSVKHTMFDVVIHDVFCSARRFAVSVGRVNCIHPKFEGLIRMFSYVYGRAEFTSSQSVMRKSLVFYCMFYATHSISRVNYVAHSISRVN
jgi:hypothetical protein